MRTIYRGFNFCQSTRAYGDAGSALWLSNGDSLPPSKDSLLPLVLLSGRLFAVKVPPKLGGLITSLLL